MVKKNINNKIEILSEPQKVDMSDDYYESANLEHFWIRSRFNVIKSKLKNIDIQSELFEIGCGNGVVMNQIQEHYKITIDGCDLNMFALNQIENNKGRVLCLDIFDLPTNLIDKYKGVFLLDVIEHIENDSDFLKTSLKYLQKGGLIVINVPAVNLLYSKYDAIQGHKRRYSKKMLRKLFLDCNIEEVSISYWGLMLIPIIFIRKIVLNFVKEEKIYTTGFKTPTHIINKLLYKILYIENKILKSPILGTSIIAIGKLK